MQLKQYLCINDAPKTHHRIKFLGEHVDFNPQETASAVSEKPDVFLPRQSAL